MKELRAVLVEVVLVMMATLDQTVVSVQIATSEIPVVDNALVCLMFHHFCGSKSSIVLHDFVMHNAMICHRTM